MFGPRTESARERVLLRMIENLQRQNMELVNQVLFLSGHMWTPPPLQPEQILEVPEEEIFVSALDGLPPTEEEYGPEPD